MGAYNGGSGGGAGSVGQNALTVTNTAGNGGAGINSSITGSAVGYAGGGGGGGDYNKGVATHGGGDGGQPGNAATAATVNRGGGGGGYVSSTVGATGVVILRMPDGNYTGTTTGSPTVATGVDGTHTVLTFTGDGTYTA